ncbi:hypothetical protein [Burkholderia pseudomallei]|uniref:hypothetical protein n=1 Tax=Burkholderia pseudomallei TaxID=28450 RepID=UPI00050ECDDE|nr:hypothetical protein [Burkholderia pseudomallei]KGD06052.1 hypothetical protein DO63_2300 [Burkholderia pseudomallei]
MTNQTIPNQAAGGAAALSQSGRVNQREGDTHDSLVRRAAKASSIEELRRIGSTWRQRYLSS